MCLAYLYFRSSIIVGATSFSLTATCQQHYCFNFRIDNEQFWHKALRAPVYELILPGIPKGTLLSIELQLGLHSLHLRSSSRTQPGLLFVPPVLKFVNESFKQASKLLSLWPIWTLHLVCLTGKWCETQKLFGHRLRIGHFSLPTQQASHPARFETSYSYDLNRQRKFHNTYTSLSSAIERRQAKPTLLWVDLFLRQRQMLVLIGGFGCQREFAFRMSGSDDRFCK